MSLIGDEKLIKIVGMSLYIYIYKILINYSNKYCICHWIIEQTWHKFRLHSVDLQDLQQNLQSV